jgi:hypothetical protein
VTHGTDPRRTFPVLQPMHQEVRKALAKFPTALPWDFVAQFERRARTNHDQDLERLAARGGLTWFELHLCVTDRPYRGGDFTKPGDMAGHIGAAQAAAEQVLAAAGRWLAARPGAYREAAAP